MKKENRIDEFKFEMGDLTYFAWEKLMDSKVFNVDDFDFEDIQVACEWEERPIFMEGVVKRLNQLGIECGINNDSDLILSEVRKRFKSRLGFRCPKPVENWIKGIAIPGVTKRKNHYDLCYALEMNLLETAEFFVNITLQFRLITKIEQMLYTSIAYIMKNHTKQFRRCCRSFYI